MSVHWLDVLSVIISLNGGKFYLHAPIGAFVINTHIQKINSKPYWQLRPLQNGFSAASKMTLKFTIWKLEFTKNWLRHWLTFSNNNKMSSPLSCRLRLSTLSSSCLMRRVASSSASRFFSSYNRPSCHFLCRVGIDSGVQRGAANKEEI